HMVGHHADRRHQRVALGIGALGPARAHGSPLGRRRAAARAARPLAPRRGGRARRVERRGARAGASVATARRDEGARQRMARARHRRITGWPRVRAARRLLPARALRAPLLARDAPLPRLHLQRDGQPHHRNGRESHTGGNVMTRTPSLARQIIVAAVILIAVVAVAAGGSLATMGNVDGWYADAEKVPWNPPNALFGRSEERRVGREPR